MQKMKKQKLTKRFIGILSAAFLLAQNVSATTPTISNVSGTVATGQTLTISGANMVDENKTNWHALFSSGNLYGFEGTYADQVSDPGWDLEDRYNHAPDADPGETTYDSTVKLMGNNSYKGRIVGAHSSNASAGLLIDTGISTGDLYVRLYSRWHSAGTISKWPTSHIKMLDIQGSGGGADQMYFQPSATDGSTLPTEMNMTYNSASHSYSVNNFLEDNRWYCMEARFNNTATPNFSTWVDGVQLANISSGLGDLAYMQAVLFGMINLTGTESDFDLTEWIDGFTVSTSRVYCSSVIEIGNSSNYATATKVYQEPLYLSDGSVQIKANLTGLGSGPYYLFVTNNRQETGSAYLLGSSDVIAPASPSGLAVI